MYVRRTQTLSSRNAISFLFFRREDVRCLQYIKYTFAVSFSQKAKELTLLEPLDWNRE